MGKRELLLIAAFVIVGAIVYQITAPAAAPGERSFSAGRLIEHVRRAIRGNRASAEVVTHSTHPVEPGVTELRFVAQSTNLTITGEDRSDIDAELQVRSTGYDEPEAQRLARETLLKVDRAGARLILKVDYPKPGAQRATVVLKVPAKLAIQLEGGGGEINVTRVATVELGNARGRAEVQNISGRVSGGHRGGELRITNAGSIKISTIGSDVRLEQIRGEVSMNMRGGDLKTSELGGPVDLDTNGVDLTLEKLEKTTGILRITANGGSVAVKGLRTEARIDARGCEVEAIIERAAPVAIYSEGNDAIDLTPPSGGYQLDAVASDGAITLPEGMLEVTTSGQEHRATGPVKGGGPTITIRNSHGNIRVRTR